jgi:cell division protein FtsW (lipid II flippase)
MAYKPSNDKILFFAAGLLTIFGLVMVYSASSVVASSKHGASSYFFVRQLMYACLGFIFLTVLMNVDYHTWQKPKAIGWMLVFCIASLGFVLTQGAVNGSHRWLRLGSFISIQPSEIAKLVVLVFLAAFLQKYENEINQPVRRLLPLGAVIGEELGLIATVLVAFAFLVYFFRGMRIVLRSPDRFGFYLGLGITLMVVLQGFINISMVLAMMPTKGIALPFISQGGSSLLLNLLATGVLLNLSHHNKPAEA